MNRENGSLTRWVVGVGLSAILLAASWGVSAVRGDAAAAKDIAIDTRTRVTVVEIRDEVRDKRLERMEAKIDALMAELKNQRR